MKITLTNNPEKQYTARNAPWGWYRMVKGAYGAAPMVTYVFFKDSQDAEKVIKFVSIDADPCVRNVDSISEECRFVRIEGPISMVLNTH